MRMINRAKKTTDNIYFFVNILRLFKQIFLKNGIFYQNQINL